MSLDVQTANFFFFCLLKGISISGHFIKANMARKSHLKLLLQPSAIVAQVPLPFRRTPTHQPSSSRVLLRGSNIMSVDECVVLRPLEEVDEEPRADITAADHRNS